MARSLAGRSLPRATAFPLSTASWSSLTLVAAFIAIVVLSFQAQPRRTGDAHQYLAMAWQLSLLRPPSLDAAATERLNAWLTAQPESSGFPDGVRAMRQPALVRDGRQEFSHFWVYPLLTAPFLRLGTALGVHPIWAFIAVNSVLLGAATWAVARAFGTLAAFVVIASPLVWFVARAQVEVFTVTLLCLAMAAAACGRWGWAAIAVALASTQNLPIAATLPLIWICAVINWRLSLPEHGYRPAFTIKQRAIAAGFLFASSVIALLHPAYYIWRLGTITPQQLNGGIAGTLPSLQRVLAPFIDPDIGFLLWLPLTALLGITGVLLSFRVARSRSAASLQSLLPIVCAVIMAGWFLCVFSQTTNVNSGGTVHLSRYALWLLPLALPAVATVTKSVERHWPIVGLCAACSLFLLYAGFFRPDQPERYVEHSPQSNWLIGNAPALYFPLPEIFVERTLHVDGDPRASAATPNCALIYVVPAQPVPSCPLTASELRAAQALFTNDAAAAWIRRGSHGSSVVAALS